MILNLVSWPRSGNTLLRSILWRCFGLETYSVYDESPRFERNSDWRALTGAARWRRIKDLQIAIDTQGVCPVKTHGWPDEAIGPDSPTIYLIRDGREACVSYWKFYQTLLESPDTPLSQIIRGDCIHGGWTRHLEAWRPKTRQNTLLLRYEELAESRGLVPGSVARKIAEFIGKDFDSLLVPQWETFQASDPVFFRSGTNETWRELMTGDDLELFYSLHGDTMQEYGYSSKGGRNATSDRAEVYRT